MTKFLARTLCIFTFCLSASTVCTRAASSPGSQYAYQSGQGSEPPSAGPDLFFSPFGKIADTAGVTYAPSLG